MTGLAAHLPPWLREAVRWQLSRSAEQVLTVEEVALLLGLPAAQVAPHARGGRLLRADVLALLETPRSAPPSVTQAGVGQGGDGPCGGC